MKRMDDKLLQRRRLAEWLRAWRLAQRLDALPEASEDETPAAAPSPYPLAPARGAVPRLGGAKSPPQAGSIVLLPPDTEATRSRPVYVALIGAAGGGRWLAVPFGRLALPAVPGELETGRRAPPLRVLCVWNAAEVDGGRLARGWPVGRLTVRERRWVSQLLNLPAHTPPPATLARRLGPPLIHPLDPRHDYLEQERLLWVETGAAVRCGEVPADYGSSLDDDALPLAAETRDNYLTSHPTRPMSSG